VVLDEIDQIACAAGFTSGLCIVPMQHPLALQTYSKEAWSRFRDGDALERLRLTDQFAHIDYWDRFILHVDKPEQR
jgi:hypothetical protein